MANIKATGPTNVYEGTNAKDFAGSFTLTTPSVASGDLMLLVLHQAHRVEHSSAPVISGWNLEIVAGPDGTGSFYTSTLIYSRISTGSESSVTVSGLYNGADDILGYITAIENHNGIDVINSEFSAQTSEYTHTCVNVTTTENDVLVLTFFTDRINGPRTSSLPTELFDNNQRPTSVYAYENVQNAGPSTANFIDTPGASQFQKLYRLSCAVIGIKNSGGGTPPVTGNTGAFFNFL